MTTQQHRLITVLINLIHLITREPEMSEPLSDWIGEALEQAQGDDLFGTENQNNPAGDGRDGPYHIYYVQGIDD